MLPPIYDILSAAPAVSAIVGTRIYPHGEAPQDVTRPYVTWFLVAGVPEDALDGAPDMDRSTVQIDCWHQTSAGVVQLASAARHAIEPHAHITNLFLNQREPETRLYRFALQLDYLLPR
jgi:Protein of unknown function (DUF3168)